MTSLNPDVFKLNRALQSAKGFDQIFLNIDPATKVFPKIEAGQLQIEPPPDFIDTPNTMLAGQAYDFIIKQIESEWICCFCDDDFFDEKELSRLLTAIRAGDFADADVINFRVHVSGIKPYHQWGVPEPKLDAMQTSNHIPAGCFFRKSVWEKTGGFKGTLLFDWIFWLRALKAGCRFKYFDGPVYWFMMRKGSLAFRETEGQSYDETLQKVLDYANS